ncbi:class I SAM-dependent methyltransferase [Paenibacillus sp. NPDC058174]|uniref:class I SAM-dependent methyltransferase n=1 Tax=Paenibacillus sp. NPDC058174 TaxID=3346366 RepID=UPI0036DBCD64
MFPDLSVHPDFVSGQSMPWCKQLAVRTGKYEYPWTANVEGQAAETVLTEKLASAVHGRVLDVGCGHGEYTNRWSEQAVEVTGYDMTEGFIRTANERYRSANVRYVVGSTKQGLPFPDHYFDVAYTKKGPTSWYEEGNRVVRPGGSLIMLHPGDGNGEGGELGEVFPGLFAGPAPGTPTLDRIQERLAVSGLTDIRMTVLKELVWLPAAEDILALLCFGQSDSFSQYVRETCFKAIQTQFDKHAEARGIKTTGFYYFIEAKASAK